MKVSNDDYQKIENNIVKFLTENPAIEVTEQIIYELHYHFCLAMREPKHPKIEALKTLFSFNPDDDYFNDFYLNDKNLNDDHMTTVFKKIFKKVV